MVHVAQYLIIALILYFGSLGLKELEHVLTPRTKATEVSTERQTDS